MDNSAIYTVGLLARHIQDLVGMGVPLSKDVDTNILCWSAAKRTTVEQISSLAVQLALLGGKTRESVYLHLPASWLDLAGGLRGAFVLDAKPQTARGSSERRDVSTLRASSFW